MSANTETTGADRTKCKAFCGWRYFDMKMGSVPYESWARSAAWPGPAKDDTVFCSQNCHDARLPPIAAPAAHIERRKRQRWRCNGGPEFVLTYREDLGSREAWNTECGSLYVGWDIAGCMTLLADAEDDETPAQDEVPDE